jgi:adenylate cyclase
MTDMLKDVEIAFEEMTESVCPYCGRPYDTEGGRLPATGDARKPSTPTQAQLIVYAQDLARAYASQKLMAQYLPGDLRERIAGGDNRIIAERRYVTVLFADLVGFTHLASLLDAEGLFGLMNSCFQRLVTHIFRYEGVIDKFMGDGLMALFGAPVAHEDDPERAVRAALDMQKEMGVFSSEMRPRLGVPLQLRIGVNSGEVIAGSVGVAERLSYTVTGETVNLAFRLQQLAEPGRIFVGETVYRQTEQLFHYQSLGEFQVKGFHDPVPVFGVREEREPSTFGPPPSDVPLSWAGRERELQHLTRLAERLRQGVGGVVVVSGEAGLGKTRLAQEWLASLPPGEVSVWWATAQLFRQRISYSLWRDLLRQGLHLQAGGVSSAGLAARRALLAQVGQRAPFLLALIHNLTSESGPARLNPDQVRSQTRRAVHDLLVAQAERHPLILIVDNWQWCDDLSRSLLFSLLTLADEHAILFCILSRPGNAPAEQLVEELQAHADGTCRSIELGPLWQAEGWDVLAPLLGVEDLPPNLRAIILNRTQGNPLYLKELLRLMKSEGIVDLAAVASGDKLRWRVLRPERLASLGVPPTLSGLAQANLDRLPPELQEILSYASVIGPSFSLALLQAVVAREQEINALPARLDELVSRGVLQTVAADGRIFAFRDTIVQETVYNSLLSQRRRAIHRLVADELEILPESDMNHSIELMAHHFMQAGVPARAVPYLIRAGHRAQNRSAHQVAIEHYSAALAVLDEAPRYEDQRLGLEMALADAHSRLGQYDEAVLHYQDAVGLRPHAEQRIDLYRLMGLVLAAKGDWQQAWRYMQQALECLAEGQAAVNATIRGEVYAACALIEWRLGDHQRAELWAREGMVILEGSQAADSLALCYETLCAVYALLGHEALADRYAAQAANLVQARGSPYTPRTAYLLDWDA